MPISSLPPSKKRKISQADPKSSKIQQLEEELNAAIAQNSSLNALIDLLRIPQTSQDPEVCSKAIYALYRIFVILITSGRLTIKGDASVKVVRAWIWERLDAYTDLLARFLSDEEKSLRTSALQVLFSLLKHLSTSASQPSTPDAASQPQFHVVHFNKIVSGLLKCPSSPRTGPTQRNNAKLDPDVRELFVTTWLNVHDDVRWFFLREAGSLIAKTNIKQLPDAAGNLLSILELLRTFPTEAAELNEWWVSELGTKPPPVKSAKGPQASAEEDADEPVGDEDDWRKFFDEPVPSSTQAKNCNPTGRLYKMTVHQSIHSLASHRAVFSRAWLALLPRLSEVGRDDREKRDALAVKALNVMHRGVMPHLTRPVMIMDWIGSCVDYGGTVGLLALNALFILMRDYNLDYPKFYTRLYAFLDKDLLHHRHRARFFRLTDLFLSSTHLPAALLASFIKRLSRLSLSAPPAAIIMVIPFTYNILKKHPALMAMINRAADAPDNDPFNSTEEDPMKTNALDSSLWELVTHRNHYQSSVSTLARILQEAFRKQSYDMEDFLDHTYSTLFESEIRRKIRKEPATSMELKQYAFPTADEKVKLSIEEFVVKGDIISELWTF